VNRVRIAKKKRTHEEIENIDDMDGPMSSTSIHRAVVRLSPVKKGCKAMFFDGGRNLPNSPGGVSGNAAKKAEWLSSEEHSSCT